MRTTRVELLRSLLLPLISEWGAPAVLRCVRELEQGELNETGDGSDAEGSRPPSARQTERPSASALVARTPGLGDRRSLIEDLARRFDAKMFLPSVGDIRFFLEMNGEREPVVKQRSEAFKRVLRVLLLMQPTLIDRLVREEAHSGPSELAPLSAAIRNAAAHRGAMLQPSERESEVRPVSGTDRALTQGATLSPEFVGPPKPNGLERPNAEDRSESQPNGDSFDSDRQSGAGAP